MTELTAQQLVGMIRAIADAISAQRDTLNTLDSALGDGDHGTGLSTAFQAAVQQIDELETPEPSAVIMATAMALMNRMGGASGALYGTLFMKMGGFAKDKQAFNHEQLAEMLQAGLAGVQQRGKAQVGDKTMVDALSPAVEAFAAADGLTSAFENAAKAARTGAESTKDRVAKYGRAKFIGERARGHVDAGASSIAVMFEAMDTYWKETGNGET